MNKKWQKDSSYLALIEDLLQTTEVKALTYYPHHHFSNRLEHSLHVSYLSYKIAKKLHLDSVAIARAGLLHDLFFYDWREIKFETGNHATNHPKIALENAKQLTHISDKEADIIEKHMFGATKALPKYPESWIVTLVDDYTAVNEYLVPKLFFDFKKIEQKVQTLLISE